MLCCVDGLLCRVDGLLCRVDGLLCRVDGLCACFLWRLVPRGQARRGGLDREGLDLVEKQPLLMERKGDWVVAAARWRSFFLGLVEQRWGLCLCSRCGVQCRRESATIQEKAELFWCGLDGKGLLWEMRGVFFYESEVFR